MIKLHASITTRNYLLTLALSSVAFTTMAQRQHTDRLDRGLVAIQTDKGVYCSWRIQADEYYDVRYNLYRDGTKVNDEPLSVSNLLDASGTQASQYMVRSVIDGQEVDTSDLVTVWQQNYLEIAPQHDASLTSTYVPNDACCADVDGDGQLEILLKYDNSEEMAALFPKEGHNGEYSLLECLEMDGTVLWWVNCGPNMGDFQNNEQNIVGYDWDGDERAEAVMRLCEGAQIHLTDGTVYTVGGDDWTNYRQPKTGGVEWFTYYGREYLVYVDGQTGRPYQCIDYPCARLEAGETDLKNAWGDGYGHRSNKHFFGAPYLDGHRPSIFVGRGIYTRHKFVALDVDPVTHELTERWRWMNNTPGPWYAQGYHNYTIADVDWDGRDEIVWGSMVIDDNGLGLSTTGLGHGDAHHVGDLNPFIHGQEGFFCNEDQPANNYRDLTTSRIYYRMVDTSDAGRAMAGNFTDDYPGAIGYGAHDTPISLVTNDHVAGMQTTGLTQNFRIYWDGDLLDECADGTYVYKYGKGQIARMNGALSNNGTKNTPCLQGDLFGDWREEVMMRTADNHIRIYTTTIPTEWRNYSLWYDHQYRNAMVWQMCGYNQPPHVSYFVGELEGFTQAPPPLTTVGRTVLTDGQTIGKEHDGQHVLYSEYMDAKLQVEESASPRIATFDVPSWVKGTAQSECTQLNTPIDYLYYQLTLQGGAFAGQTRLVKQGDGILVLPNTKQTYSGPTEIWAGTLCFDGVLSQSPVWLNRFASLRTEGGNFDAGIRCEYGSTVEPLGTVSASCLDLGYGAQVRFNLDGANTLKVDTLKLEHKTWSEGPAYLAPVFCFESASVIEAGYYPLIEAKAVEGDLSLVAIEGIKGLKSHIEVLEGVITLVVNPMRDAEEVTWTGVASDVWDLDNTPNFASSNGNFVSGDQVIFSDDAQSFTVNIVEEVSPQRITFTANQHDYEIVGESSIVGNCEITLDGDAKVSIGNTNTFQGQIIVNHGSLVPATLANKDGVAYGALGGIDNRIVLNNRAKLVTQSNMTTSHPVVLGTQGGTIDVANGTLTLNGKVSKLTAGKSNLYKEGKGTLQFDCGFAFDTLFIEQGTVYDFVDNHFASKTVVLDGGTLQYNNSIYSYNDDNVNIIVPEGHSGAFYPDGRCDYLGTLSGSGTIDIHATFVRTYFKGDWSKFAGTINAYTYKSSSYDPSFDFLNTYGIGNATLNITNGVAVHTNGQNFAIGALTGTGSIDNAGSNGSGANTLTLGGKNVDFKFDGTIVGSKVTKVGTGVWTVTDYATLYEADQVTVNGGSLKLNSTSAPYTMTGKKTLTINQGGALTGRGLVQNVVLNEGGECRPGIANTPTGNAGVIQANGNITAKAGADIYLNKSAQADYNSKTGQPLFTYLEAEGSIKIDANVHFSYKDGNAGWTPQAGDVVMLFKAAQLEGQPVLDLQALPDDLVWDTSTLMTDGLLRVANASGIQPIAPDQGPQHCLVYDMAGTQVASFDTASRSEIMTQMQRHGLKSSVYLVRIEQGDTVVVHRVVLR